MKKIAILFPGDMGGALAKILVEDGFLVTSFLEGRSQRTRNSAAAAGVLGLPSWNQLAAESELVISLVPPSAVVSVAESYAAAAKAVGSKAVFVDANAKSPATATQVAGIIRQANAPFVNACVIGGANSLREKGAIFVSGPDSSALVESLKGSVAVTDLGSDIERVSAFKMTFTGLNKTIAAAWFETALAAHAFDIFDPLFDEIAKRSPVLWNHFSRSFSSYPRHLARRREEMSELAEMLMSRDLPHGIASGAASTFQAILDEELLSPETGKIDGKELLKRLSIPVKAG